MGVDPVTGIVSLTVVTGLALALYIEECQREEERRRQQEEDRRRWRKKEEKREREARRERLREERERRKKTEREERERRAEMERVERERMEREERRRRQEEAEERRRLNASSNYLCGYDPFKTSEEYRRSWPFHTTNQREYSFNSYSYENEAENRICICGSCILPRDESPPRPANFYETFSSEFDPFQTSEEYRRSWPFHTTNQREYSFNSYSYENEAENRICICGSCILLRDESPPRPANFYETFSSEFDPFQTSEEYRRSRPFHATNQREYSFQSSSYMQDNEAENRNCDLRRGGSPPGVADFYETFSSEFDPFQTSEEYYRSQPFYSSSRCDNVAENRNCVCQCCSSGSLPRAVSPPSRTVSPSRAYDPFSSTKGSVILTIKQTQTAPDKNQNVKNEGSSNKPTSSSSQDATSSKSTSKQKTNASKNSSSGSDQPHRNNNNNNNNNNNSDKKNTVQDYGKLNDFIEILKAILDRCKVSKEIREKILAFFNKFEKHEENFSRLLEDFRILNIAIEDIVSIVVRLFQSDYFAEDVAYPNFLALMEIVAKYLKDELIMEMVEDSIRGSKKSHEQQREECMKKVLQRENILSEITALFEKARKEIVEDNDREPLNPDFSGIFAKVYHYIKHKVVRGKEWTVTEYFDWVRKLLVSLKNLTPEYGELSNVNHARRQIVFEVYSTAYQGYFRIVVRAYGPEIQICTFFLREKRDKKAKDGDKYVDGKKKS